MNHSSPSAPITANISISSNSNGDTTTTTVNTRGVNEKHAAESPKNGSKRTSSSQQNMTDPTGEYIIEQSLGRGGHGSVYLARHRKTNILIALKITQNVRNTYVEVEAISKLKHPHVLKIFDCRKSADSKLIFVYLELCRGGELFNKIVANPEGKLSRRQAHRYCGQLLEALAYCHSRGIAHRDIKPENLLLGENDNLKIADFGLAYLLGKHNETETWNLAQSKCGTALYAAPEIWNEQEYNPFSADIWSAGVVLFCCLCGYPPFNQASTSCSKYRKFIKGQFNWPKSLHIDDRELLKKILEPDPTKRYTSTQILRHKLIHEALKSGNEYVRKYIDSKKGLLRPTPLKETVETLKRRREQVSEAVRRKKNQIEAEIQHFHESSSSNGKNANGNNDGSTRATIGALGDHSVVHMIDNDDTSQMQDNNVTKFRRRHTEDSIHSDTTDYSNNSNGNGENQSAQTVGDAEKLADSILRKVLGVDIAHNYNKNGSSSLVKAGAKYSVSARLKLIDGLTNASHDMYEGPFNAQWAVAELRKVKSRYEQYVNNQRQGDQIELRRRFTQPDEDDTSSGIANGTANVFGASSDEYNDNNTSGRSNSNSNMLPRSSSNDVNNLTDKSDTRINNNKTVKVKRMKARDKEPPNIATGEMG